MKKVSILFASFLLVAGGNYYAFSQTKPKAGTRTSTASKATPSKADLLKGKDLLSKSDCLACHQEQVKVVGPSYASVAEKYPNTDKNVNMLVEKIVNGGAGNWGPVPMTPHPGISNADAKKMVQYILSIKGK